MGHAVVTDVVADDLGPGLAVPGCEDSDPGAVWCSRPGVRCEAANLGEIVQLLMAPMHKQDVAASAHSPLQRMH